jgi:hypothetical protein
MGLLVRIKTSHRDGRGGQVAQSVEQRTENPRVGGSTPPLSTRPQLLDE